MTTRRRIAVAAALVAATLVPLGGPQAAAQDPNWVCDAYDQTAKRGRTPVADADGHVFPIVTIHGITGSDSDFDGTIDKSYIGANPQPPRSLLDALAGAKTGDLPPGLEGARVLSFSYTPDSLRWVDNPAVGEKFARTIDCLYEKFGVPVSVVAHSMGGLVTRWVANTTDGSGRPRSAKLGKIVTLGTPYQGSLLSSLANGATDALASGPAHIPLSFLNYLCGQAGTSTGKDACGPIPLYASFRSEAGRNLRMGSDALTKLARWPAGTNVTTLAGSERVPLNLIGSRLNTSVDIGDIAVPTSSATADPTAGRVFTCSYDSASESVLTSFKEILKLADPKDRQAKLTGAFLASPCYHSNLMRYVELTNEVLGQLNDWLSSVRARPRSSPTWEEIKNAAIPEMCTHPPTKLVNGKDVTVDPSNGFFELLQTLPNGEPGIVQGIPSEAGPLTAVVVSCNAGGVGWPNPVMFFSAGGKYYGVSYLGEEADWEGTGMYFAGRDGITGIWLRGDEVEVYTSAELPTDASCCPSSAALVRLRPKNGEIAVTSIEEDIGD